MQLMKNSLLEGYTVSGKHHSHVTAPYKL